jgi:2-hydroxy-3-oxopropionate reductase
MATVGFIGLGIMGTPMAINLAGAGFTVRAFNRSRPTSPALLASPVVLVDSIEAAASGADVVATMLPDSPDVVAVTRGGAFAAAKRGTLFVDFSTIRPDVTRSLSAEAATLGLRFVDAPVSGGEQGAKDAALSVMVGGTAEDFALALPVLDAVGATVIRVGETGAGQTVKAANQLMVGGTIALLAEALVFLAAHDVDPGPALEVLGGGLAGSTVMARKGPSMTGRDFAPGFRIALHLKDLRIFSDAARESGVTTPMGALVGQLMGALVAQGHGDLDHSAMLLLAEELSGRSEPSRSAGG